MIVENIGNNLTIETYSTMVCPLIRIKGVFKLVNSQLAYLQGDTVRFVYMVCILYHT